MMITRLRLRNLFFCLAVIMTLSLTLAPVIFSARSDYKPAPENLEARRWFQDAKFGLFIHWGVYSVLGKGEWVMNNDKLPISEYETLPPQFNPAEFDSVERVALAKATRMHYTTLSRCRG